MRSRPIATAPLLTKLRAEDYSFDFYMETTHVSLSRGTQKIQKLGV
jgi:hypothetical protein